MKTSASTIWVAPHPQSRELVLPNVPVTEWLLYRQLPMHGINLLNGNSANYMPSLTFKMFEQLPSLYREQYTVLVGNFKVQLENTIISSYKIDVGRLSDTTLLPLESQRTTVQLAEKIRHDTLQLLIEKYKIERNDLLKVGASTYKTITEYPYIIDDLLELSDYQHIDAVIYTIYGDEELHQQRMLYLRKPDVQVKRTSIFGDVDVDQWRWPTETELLNPPEYFNPFAVSRKLH